MPSNERAVACMVMGRLRSLITAPASTKGVAGMTGVITSALVHDGSWMRIRALQPSDSDARWIEWVHNP